MPSVPPRRRQRCRRRQIPFSLLPLRFRDPARQAPQEHCSDPEGKALPKGRHLGDGSGDSGGDES